MFYGNTTTRSDRKGRLLSRRSFRDAVKEHYVEKLVVTRGLDQVPLLFP